MGQPKSNDKSAEEKIAELKRLCSKYQSQADVYLRKFQLAASMLFNLKYPDDKNLSVADGMKAHIVEQELEIQRLKAQLKHQTPKPKKEQN